MKKKKKKRPAAKNKIILIMLCFIMAAGLFFIKVIHRKIAPSPVFEEEYVTSSQLKKSIDKVDQVIYDSLHSLGIKKEAISFSQVVPRHESNLDWDFTELSVVIDNPDFIDRLETVITKKTSVFGSDINIKSGRPSADLAVISITIFKHSTHRLKLYRRVIKTITETKKLPKVAFIIDDIGYDIPIAEAFMDLKMPVALSLLPDAPYSKEIAWSIVKRSKEMLIHLPMQPKGYPKVNPGKDALMVSMDRETIQQIVRESIEKLPGAKGVNHHMGSLFSEDYIKMKYVIDEIKKHDLYYVDSRTTNLTAAYKVAKAIGVLAAEKSLFIDNDLNDKILDYQMERLLSIARGTGFAIGIAHPHHETLALLKRYEKALKENYQVVEIKELAK